MVYPAFEPGRISGKLKKIFMQFSFFQKHELFKTRTVVVFPPDLKLECLTEIYKTYKNVF